MKSFQFHPAERKVRIAGANLDLQDAVQRQLRVARGRREDLDIGRQVGHHLNAMSHGFQVPLSVQTLETDAIAGVQRCLAIGTQLQHPISRWPYLPVHWRGDAVTWIGEAPGRGPARGPSSRKASATSWLVRIHQLTRVPSRCLQIAAFRRFARRQLGVRRILVAQLSR